ncbi:MAG: fasciclin domain-containing protein [Myxococcales bacterium]
MKTTRWSFRLLLTLGALAGSAACGDDNDGGQAQADAGGDGDGDAGNPAGDKNIVETAAAAGTFKTLAQALTTTGLDQALAGPGPFTVFAPTDAAFDALGESTLSSLGNDELAAILKYHVVAGEVESSDLKAGPVKTLGGLSAFVKLGSDVTINDAKVTSADVQASNGVIHVIDKVLLPPNLVQAASYAGDFGTLLSAATKAGLADALSNPEAKLTVFAPTDAAFAKLPAGTLDSLSKDQLTSILTYHVVNGEVLSTQLKAGAVKTLNGADVTVDLSNGVKVNDAKVVLPDIVTSNGVIHVIDGVLMPPG